MLTIIRVDIKMESTFNLLVDSEFPNGVDANEFAEFLKNKQYYIFKVLGNDEDKNN